MSESQEVSIGRSEDKKVRQQYGIYDDAALQRYVSDIGQRLAKSSHRAGLQYQFLVVDSPEINAFALPGGYIYITLHLPDKPELNYGVAPFPCPASKPDRKNTVVVAGTVALIPSGVKNPQASGLLLSWMMSPEILAEEMVANFNLPTTKEAAKDPRFLENERLMSSSWI